MTPSMLAALILIFCDVPKPPTPMDDKTHTCVNFMINCSVDAGGVIDNAKIDACKDQWYKDNKKITVYYGKESQK